MDELTRIEHYLDAAPRRLAEAQESGPFTLFVASPGVGWRYYARPSHTTQRQPTPADVARLRVRQRELGEPESLEWVDELARTLATSAAAAGLQVRLHPLLVLQRPPVPVPPPPGVAVRLVDADDPAVAAGRVVADLAFGHPGTSTGDVGTPERDAALVDRPTQADDALREQLRRRQTVMAVVEDVHDGVVAVGMHIPLDGVTEVVGVATLPSHRRRGIAAAVTAALVSDALAHRCDVVFLSAGDDRVARVYERVGFRRVGHAGAAEPAATGSRG